MRLLGLISFVALSGLLVFAHPGEEHEHISAETQAKRELEERERTLLARNCAAEIRAFEMERMARRNPHLRRQVTSTFTAQNPHYTTIQNNTCITAPEVTEGPYYVNNEYIRPNLKETQGGVTLVLDVGVLDITTCKPLQNAFVELWAANATGIYGGYQAGGNVHTDTFLRGGYFTNAGGVVELTTIYPGWYTGRTAHIHAMVHKDWASSGSQLVSSAGSLVHIGQFFFDETWNTRVYATSPYTTNHQSRTTNAQDGILQGANSGGYSAYVSLQYLSGSTVANGLLGYITVGVDSTKKYTIQNKNAV